MKIRHAAFETNSSSSHSFTLADTTEINEDISIYKGKPFNIWYGEFGWGPDKFYTLKIKASYCITYIAGIDREAEKRIAERNLESVLKEVLECSEINYLSMNSGLYGKGYIDHQSAFTEKPRFYIEVLSEEENLKKFLFNKKSVLRIDHDNY